MIYTLYAIPSFIYTVNDWETKKTKLLSIIDDTKFERLTINGVEKFTSDRRNSPTYTDQFVELFSEELQQLGKDLELMQFKIEDIWTVHYNKGDYHDIHTHGTCNLSGVLYLNYDHHEHTPTRFVPVQFNSLTNMTDVVSPEVKEGQFVFFPSNILHYTDPNKSDKIRSIVSLDITTNKKIY